MTAFASRVLGMASLLSVPSFFLADSPQKTNDQPVVVKVKTKAAFSDSSGWQYDATNDKSFISSINLAWAPATNSDGTLITFGRIGKYTNSVCVGADNTCYFTNLQENCVYFFTASSFIGFQVDTNSWQNGQGYTRYTYKEYEDVYKAEGALMTNCVFFTNAWDGKKNDTNAIDVFTGPNPVKEIKFRHWAISKPVDDLINDIDSFFGWK